MKMRFSTSITLTLALASSSWGLGERMRINPDELTIEIAPGLPSLESLNITIADLLDPAYLTKRGFVSEEKYELDKRVDPACHGYTRAQGAELNLAYGCYNYLFSLGQTSCQAGTSWVYMCRLTNGDDVGAISGKAIDASSAASYCRDVAVGSNWVIENCQVGSNTGVYVSGTNAANGNGNLLVALSS
jgi:hypothetical protein